RRGAGADEEARGDRETEPAREGARQEDGLVETPRAEAREMQRDRDEDCFGGERVTFCEQRAERVRHVPAAAVLERLDGARERIETGGGGEIQCCRSGAGEGGWMTEARRTGSERVGCGERSAAAAAEWSRERRDRTPAGGAQTGRMAERQRCAAGLAVGREHGL